MKAPMKPAIDLLATDDTENGEALARMFQEIEGQPSRDDLQIDDPSPETTRS